MRLTNKQLENDLYAARQHRTNAEKEVASLAGEVNALRLQMRELAEQRDDWKFAFKVMATALGKGR